MVQDIATVKNEKKKEKEKDQQVKIHNFPGGTSEIILKKIDELVADKPYCIIKLYNSSGYERHYQWYQFLKPW